MAIEQPVRTLLNLEGKTCNLVRPEQIPHVLVHHRQWVCWRYIDRGEGRKPDKQPVNPRTLANAGVHWANTWAPFDEAYATYLRHYNHNLHGIGFVLTQTDPYVAIDLDGCMQKDEITHQAAQIINVLGSYTEISPSGQGLRILVACPGFHDNVRRVALEIYSHRRYVTITGQHVTETPSTISTVSPHLLTSLLPAVPKESSPSHPQVSKPKQDSVSDLELWERIFAHDKYGHQHLKRFQGDSSLDRGDHSFTIIRLLNCLARWTQGDPARMRRMMLLSPLVNDKWFEKRGGGDWLDHQIGDANTYISKRKEK